MSQEPKRRREDVAGWEDGSHSSLNVSDMSVSGSDLRM